MGIFKAHSLGCMRHSASSSLPHRGCVCHEPLPWPFPPFLARVTFQSLPAPTEGKRLLCVCSFAPAMEDSGIGVGEEW